MEENRGMGWGEQPRLPRVPGPSSFPGHGAGGSLPPMSPPQPCCLGPRRGLGLWSDVPSLASLAATSDILVPECPPPC